MFRASGRPPAPWGVGPAWARPTVVPIDWDIRRFTAIESTNTWLIEQARQGAPEGTVAVADHQTAGRGRRDRRWIAPPGSSLLCSILLRPGLERRSLLTATVALAGAAACEVAAGVRPDLKWPNDLMVGDRKVAGVLAEADGDAVVVGIGINVSWPDELPEEIAATATALNHVTGRAVDRDEVLDGLLAALDQRYPALDVIDELRRTCVTVGRHVRVDLGDRQLEGEATGLDDDGALILDGHRILAGDVVHLR